MTLRREPLSAVPRSTIVNIRQENHHRANWLYSVLGALCLLLEERMTGQELRAIRESFGISASGCYA
jgi:hypothetical protein